MLFTKPKNASARGRGRSGGIERTKKAQLRSKGSWEADGRRVCFERARRAEDALVARQARGSTAGKGSWKVDALRIRFERVGCEKTRATHATESRGARRCGRESKVRVRAFGGLTAKRGGPGCARSNRARRAPSKRGGPKGRLSRGRPCANPRLRRVEWAYPRARRAMRPTPRASYSMRQPELIPAIAAAQSASS